MNVGGTWVTSFAHPAALVAVGQKLTFAEAAYFGTDQHHQSRADASTIPGKVHIPRGRDVRARTSRAGIRLQEAIRIECGESSRRRVRNLLQRLYDSGARDAGLLAGITRAAIARWASCIAALAPVDESPDHALIVAARRWVQALAGSSELTAQSRWAHEVRVVCHVARVARVDLSE